MTTSRDLAQRLIDAARRDPDAIAVIAVDGSSSYREIDERADRLAQTLAAAGVRAGDRVALWLAKSSRAIVAMQAALRLGAIYVPIDPHSPGRRARKVILDAGACCLVMDEQHRSPMEPGDSPLILIGSDDPGASTWTAALAGSPSARASASVCEQEDLAYILYTSGSTGTPKGVAISHRAALAFVDWAVEMLAAGPADRFACHAPLHFDLSVLDIYAAFSVGACVCLIAENLGPAEHVAFIRTHEISVWYSVPSALMLMIDHGGLLELELEARPRVILFAGEPFPIKHLRRLHDEFRRTRLLNLYGPTETNVCTFYELGELDPARTKPVPIGKPCCGDEAWAVRADGERAEIGEEGELWVRGPTTMTGYWGQPPLGDRPYATGDIVRVLDDHGFEYIGRRDHMVKVRGMRIDLGEIEAALLEHPSIHAAAVLVTGSGLDARLSAFLRLEGGVTPISLLRLKQHCAERLPRYMIIDKATFLAELPTTRNGKIDRRALADLANPASHASHATT